MTQGALFLNGSIGRLSACEEQLGREVCLELGGDSLILRRFLAFHRSNPQVFELILRFAQEVRHRPRFGMKAIFERIRWEMAITTNAVDFKLNNNHTSLYARLLSLYAPGLAHLFTTRRLGGGHHRV